MKPLKEIPHFANEDEEFELWQNNDSTDYLDWSKANSLDIPYQSLVKMLISEGLKRDRSA